MISMNVQAMLLDLSSGMIASLKIFCLTLLFSLPLGLIVAFGRMSKNVILRSIIKVYISIMRGTPLMLQLMVVYFGPYYIFGIRISNNYRFYATLIGFALNYSAYFAEIYRGGIESMPRGQYEAAQLLGYTKVQTFMKIILPQVIKRILPSVTNEIITLVKDTSLAFAIGYSEMFTTAKAWASKETNMIPYAGAAVFYYIFNLVVAMIMEHIEKRLNYYE
ncbi:MAG: amino acid ABC transporter permease [Candidatus Choladocola sp.]|nr:amino acid ABC transporter permease [Candidatus Choladocola sp.]